jgi:peptide/nickel transport system substrate-binding protein
MKILSLIATMVGLGLCVLTPGDAEAQQRGGSMKIVAQPEPATLVLGLNQQTTTMLVGGKIYEALLTFDHDLKPRPGLATEWTVSPDGLIYTFRLRNNVRWHDGRPFTSADVIFTTQTLLMETHPRARSVFSRVASFSAPDEHTVVFTLKEPFEPFLHGLELSSAPMMPRHIYEGSDFRNNPANQAPIGTGPFKFKDWRKGQYIHLVRNEDYYEPGLPYLDELYFRVIPDAASRLIAIESGEVDLTSSGDIDYVFIPQLRNNPKLNVLSKGYEFTAPMAWIEFNHRTKPMDDPRFRQAVLHAIDRQFIVEKIWFGQAKVATGPVASYTRFYEPRVPQYSFDPAKSEQLLDQMGLVKGSNGKRVQLRLLPLPYGETWAKLAEFVKQSLARVGIDVRIESTDAAGWGQRVSNWEFDMAFNLVSQWADPALGVSRTYQSSNIRKGVLFTNSAGYSNQKVDALFELGAKTVGTEERHKHYSAVQELLAQDVPVAWLIEIQPPTVINSKFKDVITTAIGVNESFARAYVAQ